MCLGCVHMREDEDPEAPLYCEAFPAGVPEDILYDGFDHRLPHPGDNGVRFEPQPDLEPEFLEAFDAPE